jgi:hypothetical protein
MHGSCPIHILTCCLVCYLAPLSPPSAYADAQLSVKSQGESTGTDAWAGQHKPDFDRRLLSESAASSALACMQHSLCACACSHQGSGACHAHAPPKPAVDPGYSPSVCLPAAAHPSLPQVRRPARRQTTQAPTLGSSGTSRTRPARTHRPSTVADVVATPAPIHGSSGAPTGSSSLRRRVSAALLAVQHFTGTNTGFWVGLEQHNLHYTGGSAAQHSLPACMRAQLVRVVCSTPHAFSPTPTQQAASDAPACAFPCPALLPLCGALLSRLLTSY